MTTRHDLQKCKVYDFESAPKGQFKETCLHMKLKGCPGHERVIVHMNNEMDISIMFTPMGMVMFDRFPRGVATIKEAFHHIDIHEVKKTDEFRCRKSTSDEVFILQRIVEVSYTQKEK